MPEAEKDITVPVLCCFAAVACFSSIPVFLRHFAGYLDSWTVNAVRYSIGALFWLPFTLVLSRRQGARHTPDRPNPWAAALIPAGCNLIGQIGFATCPYYATAPTIGFVIRSSLLFTIGLSFLFIPSERPLARRPLFAIGAAVCMAGVFMMYAQKLLAGGAAAGDQPIGLVIILATAAWWGAYAVSVRRYMHGYPVRLAFGIISLYTAAALVVLMLALGDYAKLTRLPGREWALLIGSGFLGITFSHVLYYKGIHGVGPVVANATTLAGPFVTYLTAMIFLSETMTAWQLLGGLTVVAGGLVLIKAKARTQKKQ